LLETSPQGCDPTAVESYVKKIPQAEFISSPQSDDGVSQAASRTPQLRAAFIKLLKKPETTAAPQAAALKDLPLVEIPATGPRGDTLAVILSGDGGWASIDRQLGNTLSRRGVSVIGLNSLKYFWARRTPEGAGQDLERILSYYFAAWKKDKVLLIGYSLGADVLPFMANRLSPQTLSRVQLIALLGLGRRVDFEFHLTNWFWDSPTTTARPVLPEVKKLRGTKTLCFYGNEERDTLCKDLTPSLATIIPLKGGHHFDGDYQAIAETILQEANTTVK
jgi:type IV secretory pathway VirJ component